MARTDTFQNWATDVANSIREKTGKTDKILANQFDTEIKSITTKENLDAELTAQNEEITEQKDLLSIAISSIKNKSTLGSLPENRCIAITDWDKNGNPIEVLIRGYNDIPCYCLKVESLTMSGIWQAKIKKIILEGNVKYIGHGAFYNISDLEDINLPDTITSVGDSCFYGCSKLKLNKLPDSLQGNLNQNNSFRNSGISIKTIPDGVEYISDTVFRGCPNITQISMRNVTAVSGSSDGQGGFSSCGLRAIWLGSKTNKNMGRYAFSKNENLKMIFVDKPRVDVEALSGYSTQFGATDATIICNDDTGFMTKEEFDSIDWVTRLEEV